jgi:hypothetical protein
LDEKHFSGRSQMQVRCTKCQKSFVVSASTPASVSTVPETNVPEATVVSKVGKGVHLPEGKSVALSVTQGPLKGKIFYFTKPQVAIGRVGTDIVVDDPEVSRKHCAVEVHGETALLVDLGSANGTFVDDHRIQTRELGHLSEFRMGTTTLMFTVTKKE